MLQLTDRQLEILRQRLSDVETEILNVTFHYPSDDEAMIRYHAQLHGKRNAYKEILDFDASFFAKQQDPSTNGV